MNTITMPGFTAERSFFGSSRNRLTFNAIERNDVIRPASVPGGPGNVPSGYNRDCKRVPYTVCVGNRCWIEYGWVCTFAPIRRVLL
jgi:hypothetical protein